jgi:hypothetical protein
VTVPGERDKESHPSPFGREISVGLGRVAARG